MVRSPRCPQGLIPPLPLGLLSKCSQTCSPPKRMLKPTVQIILSSHYDTQVNETNLYNSILMPDLATSERTLRELEKRPSQHPQKRWIAGPWRLGRDTLGAFSARCPQTLFTAVCPQTPTSACNFIGSCQARGQPCPSEAWKCLEYLPSLPQGTPSMVTVWGAP